MDTAPGGPEAMFSFSTSLSSRDRVPKFSMAAMIIPNKTNKNSTMATDDPPPSSSSPAPRQKNQALRILDGHFEDSGDERSGGVEHEECESGFLHAETRRRGRWALLIVAFLLALSIGAVIGLVPDAAADRYARVLHMYNGTDPCDQYGRSDKPEPCRQGVDDAQSSATVSNGAMNVLSFLLNPVLGSASDARGRKPILLLSLVLSALPAAVLVLMLHVPALGPFWYYAANATGGINYFFGIAFAALSDAVPDPGSPSRATSYGLFLAFFYGGFAIGPSLSLLLNRFGVAVASLLAMVAAIGVAALAMPETLPPESRRRSHPSIVGSDPQSRGRPKPVGGSLVDCGSCVARAFARPFREISILNQNSTIRLVAVGSFFGAMVYASDVTLVIYYIVEQLNVRDADLAHMFLLMGVVGIALQGGLLPPLIRLFGGESRLLVATFLCGVVHNTLYGVAAGKSGVLVALLLSQFTKLNFPILSSIASQLVSPREQGQVQGALSATNAIACAFGPLSMEYVYGMTKAGRTWYAGPGTMFFYAAALQVIGTVTVCYIRHKPTTNDAEDDCDDEVQGADISTHLHGDLEEPLLFEASRIENPSDQDYTGE